MRIYVGVTDSQWFDFPRNLAAHPVAQSPLLPGASKHASSLEPIDEVNFWQPSADSQFQAIRPGDLFLFKLHRSSRTAHRDLIAGGGVFARFSILPISIAWEAFKLKNGAASLPEMRRQIARYRRVQDNPFEDFKIGCIILTQPFFFDESDWFPVPEWSQSIVRGKTFDLDSDAGRAIWQNLSVRLGEVCETKMGGTPSTKDTEYWEPPEIVWVTPEDLEKCELNRVFSSRRLISRAGLEKSSAKLFPDKTVLLSTTATIGKVGVAKKPLSANQQISGIFCGDNVNPELLAYYLLRLGESGLKQLGGTATATHINQTNLRSLLIPLPPLSQQQRIVAHLEAVQEKVKAIKEAQARTDEDLRRLEQAILDRAFRGEL